MLKDLDKLMRLNRLPHIWCPGCGNGIIMKAIMEAINECGLDQNKTVVVSGIGCSSRASGYLNFDTLHTAHGRAITFATGVKLARPELNVFVVTGDGDGSAIGGNHLIHAARRNIDLNVIMFNNNIYGMTGGQYSPMTPQGKLATTSPYGNLERSFDICKLAEAAGATYVGRSTVYHVKLLESLIKNAIKNKGFSFVEAISLCPISYGRRNKLGDAPKMMAWLKEHAVNIKAAEKMEPEKLEGRFLIGEMQHKQAPEYTQLYDELIAKLQKGAGENGR
ncbi:MAG: 2-oxoacid:ferredoxin oxidoreductase subunit beta [Clostridia bacterium]|nr:2-oxoacid:ferredoxin oxidoreductase subunit beta [Clostridia bacterium]